jgi:hypothetical protein
VVDSLPSIHRALNLIIRPEKKKEKKKTEKEINVSRYISLKKYRTER